jgi:TorA maturation chaperone TorD
VSHEPPTELLRALAVLAEPPGPEHAALAAAVGLEGAPEPDAYTDLFLFQLYPYASVYLGSEGMMGGEARARVAGFWTAVGRTPPAEPDHLSALLGLYAGLAEEEVSAEGPEALLLAESRRALLDEHLGPWLFCFLERVREMASGFYRGWAALLARVLEEEVRASDPPGPLAAQLRDAPELADPREEGGAAFLDGLLAPVRCGTILARADLARIALELDLGLRAGERRFALESLMGQEASGVLAALAGEARRQTSGHRAREVWLGASATFSAERAEASATLLDALASESVALVAEAETAAPAVP